MNYFARIILNFLVGCALYSATAVAAEVDSIEKYKIKLPEELIKSAQGFYPGIGSSLEFYQKNQNEYEFWGISDRGANFPYQDKDAHIISFSPQYLPKIVKISLNTKTKKAEVKEFFAMNFKNELVYGINPNQNPRDEIITDTHLKQITSKFGLDTESISILPNGQLVVGDEFYPSINIVDPKSGKIVKRFIPGDGLPKIFEARNFNRGFEALTVAPNGKIYAILEGVLNIDPGQSKKMAKFIRMVEVDVQTNSARTFAYEFDAEYYSDSSKVKIGDMAAIDNDNFLLVEQGETKNKDYRNVIYSINIKDATDISKIELKTELELAKDDELKQIKFLTKNLLLDVRKEIGWSDKKLEGLAYIDAKTIAITNDNDFGVDGYQEKKLASCQQSKTNKCTEIIPIINKNVLETNLWVIRFKQLIN